MSRPFEGRLFNFNGTANYVIEGKSNSTDARGSVFLAADRQVDGLSLEIIDDNFGKSGLRISTLNEDGKLDYSRTQAFAYVDKAFKLAHPMTVICSVTPGAN